MNVNLTEKLSGMHDTCTSIADKVILDKEISKSVKCLQKRRTIRVYDLQCEKKTVVQFILIFLITTRFNQKYYLFTCIFQSFLDFLG